MVSDSDLSLLGRASPVIAEGVCDIQPNELLALTTSIHTPALRVPQGFFYGYLMVPVASLAQICTAPGQTFAISAFIPAIRDSLQLSEISLTSAYMIGTLVAAFPLMLVGPIADRIGNRATITGIVLLLAGACFFASFVNSFATLLLAFLALRFLGQGSLSLLSSNTTSMWFRTKLGRVSAIMSIGMAGAFAVIPGWLLASIESYGWRETYRGLGLIVAGIMLPLLAVVYRNRPEDVGQHLDGNRPDEPLPHAESSRATGSQRTVAIEERSLSLRDAMRQPTFWILMTIMSAWAMIGTGLVFYLFAIGEARGIDKDATAAVFKTFALSMLAMQFSGGFLADRFALHHLLFAGVGLLSLGTLTLFFAQTSPQLHLFGLLFGAGQGITVAVNATVWVRYYGRAHLGKIRGTSWSASVAGSGAGPFLLGWAKDHSGHFEPAIIAFLCILIPLVLLALWVRPPARPDVLAPAAS